MPRTREVGTLWIGGPLSWLEQLCLKSFVDKGQKITLFSYEDIPNVPDGVIRRDGRDIIDTDDFIKYEQKNSYALFADWFRLHMIHQCPGMIWVDTDVYCYRPMDYDSDYVFGYELPGEHRVNNAVLGLPASSEVLRQMLRFTDDRYSIAPFLPKKRQAEMRRKADKGKPLHITEQPWGVWGPMMVTHYVHELGLEEHVQPLNAFYPITFRERHKFMRRAELAEGLITDQTTALHLWASNKRQLGTHHDGLPPKESFLERLVQSHGIVPARAPIKRRGRTTFDGALIDELDLTEVNSVADLAGTSRGFVLSLHHKFDCDIHLVNTNRRAKFKDQGQPVGQGPAPGGCALQSARVRRSLEGAIPQDIHGALSALRHARVHGCAARIGGVPLPQGLWHKHAAIDPRRRWHHRHPHPPDAKPACRGPGSGLGGHCAAPCGHGRLVSPRHQRAQRSLYTARPRHAGRNIRQPRHRDDKARGSTALGVQLHQGTGMVHAGRSGRRLDVVS